VEVKIHFQRGEIDSLTLIKSVLSSIPTYFLSLFPLPVLVANKLETIQRKFLWGSFGSDFKYHLVKWNIIKNPLPDGGLGVRDLILFNVALLGKWLLRFFNEKDSLWRRVVRSKYADNGFGWYPSRPKGAYGQGLWRFIQLFSFRVGVGSSISFWHDRWCEEGPLRDLFPSLYVLAVNRDASMADYYQNGPDGVVWSSVFIRDAFVDDSILTDFLSKLNEVTPQDSTDAVSWNLNSKGIFTVKSYYLKLLSYSSFAIQASAFRRFPWKII